MRYTLNQKIKNIILEYENIKVDGKSVVCPYYINTKIVKGELGVLAGKGLPKEIIHEVKVWAKVKGFDIEKASDVDIREFMIQQKIGIDCSGFVVNVLNDYLKQEYGKQLMNFLRFPNNSFVDRLRRFLRPIENIGANLLTSDINTHKIENYNDVRPGDLIRAKGTQANAHHVALITDVELDGVGNVINFEYVHSHRFYGKGNGIRRGKICLLDKNLSLEHQKWDDIGEDGINYFLQDYLIEKEDNGIRRLKFLDNSIFKVFQSL
jgi:hypothetical protein